MKSLQKKIALLLTVAIFASLLSVVPASAATLSNKKTINAGQVYYIMDSDISTHKITSNYFVVTPQTTTSSYDIIFATGTASAPVIRSAVGLTGTFTSPKTSAYIKSSLSSNTGALLGIRVRKGTVVVTLYSTSNTGKFGLSLKLRGSNQTPLRARTVAKGKRVNFAMAAGNVDKLPLIFGGTKGSKIKRTLSSNKYELYTFGGKKLTRATYVNKVKTASVTISYNTVYALNGKQYLCSLIQVPVSSKNRVTGWMKNTKGDVVFIYPRDFLSVKYSMK